MPIDATQPYDDSNIFARILLNDQAKQTVTAQPTTDVGWRRVVTRSPRRGAPGTSRAP